MIDKNTLQCIINDRTIGTDANPNMTVLDFLRNNCRLTGTKEGCREGDCGACTILVGELHNDSVVYRALNSCLLPLGDMQGKHVVTIEGINQQDSLNPLQQAYVDEGGTQCGFCTPGFLMSLTGYCLNTSTLTVDGAINAVEGNICRCTGHPPIRKAIAKALHDLEQKKRTFSSLLERAIDHHLLPAYASSIPQRLKALAETQDRPATIHEYTQIVSGGTDVYVQQAFTIKQERIKRIWHLKHPPVIWDDEEFIHCSGMTSIEEFSRSQIIRTLIPKIAGFISLFGSTAIRNRATLAGNIVNASPVGDMTSLLLALNATLVLREENGTRQVALRNFYKGYKQIDKRTHEMVETILLPKPSLPLRVNFEKVSRRRHLDIASVNSAMVLSAEGRTLGDVHLTAGGVFATPLFLSRTSRFLSGKELTQQVISEAMQVLQSEIEPISDVRGSCEYKRLLARQLFLAHVVTFFPDFPLRKDLR